MKTKRWERRSAVMAAIMIALAASDAAAQPRGRRITGETMLRAQDANRDGKVDREEAAPRLKRVFDLFDANQDGGLDRAELDAVARQIAGRLPAAGEAASPDNVIRHADIVYREGNDAWKLDLYLPQQAGDSLRPALVVVHGGGWRSGDKGGGLWRSLPERYAAEGYVCISINYRLTDQATFPACLQDVKCAVRWLRAHAEQYRVDPQRIGAFGISAGAHLVALLGLTADNDELEGDGPYLDQSSAVQAVCCCATPSDFTQWRAGGGSGAVGLLLGKQGDLARKARLASPVTHAAKEAPPFLIIHGDADRTVDVSQGDALHRALREAGADVTYLRLEGAGHGVFQQKSAETEPALRKFFARTLAREPGERAPQGSGQPRP